MRRIALLAAFIVVAAACTGGEAATTTESSTTTVVETTTTTSTTVVETTTTTTLPADPPIASSGDENETVQAAQFLLNCGGYGDLTVDGKFGPATLAAVQAAQAALGRATTGAVDEGTMADLARGCFEVRPLSAAADPVTVVGNAAAADPEVFTITLLSRSTLSVAVLQGTGVSVTVTDGTGTVIDPTERLVWDVEAQGDYRIEIGAEAEPVTFTIEVGVVAGTAKTGDWILATNGVTYKTTKLSLGADAGTVIDKVFEFLGHGVRGNYDEFDTGWYAITDPLDMGLRGIFIEGFAFLFYGPDPNNLDRPETLARIRFEGPSDDAAGTPRPDNYATTAKGITVGDTLADLTAAYGSGVKSGSNSTEHYYRFADSGGVLCFYFGATAPADSSPITEIATECRTG
ncbi:MAG TPA: peptidoglycan-binding protein [Acidimicrobiia bacterium]|nr:peptidoglycan-binding protein [Acidimicrobiia bacterium]